MVGLVDTLVVGRFAGTLALAGIGLGAVIYGIVYWGFGFLRMSTAGLAAQSDGASDERAVQAHLWRAVPLGLFIGVGVVLLQAVILPLILGLYTAGEGIETEALSYLRARLWGLPATLGGIALMGWFVGLGQAGRAFRLQLALNLVNAPLSVLFVAGLGWGVAGAGLSSAIAEWAGLLTGLWLARGLIRRRGGIRHPTRAELLDPAQLRRLGTANVNIFIRTAALVFGFNFFANAAAGQGEVFLAGNHILMQFVTLIALVLDAYAHTAESAAGAAFGRGERGRFDRAVRLTFGFSGASACVLAALTLAFGPAVIDLMTPEAEVRASARAFLPFCALVPLVGFAAYHLDGIFVGATATRAMRDAALLALAVYLGAHALLSPRLGAVGIWTAFLIYYVARAVTLGARLPGLRAQLRN